MRTRTGWPTAILATSLICLTACGAADISVDKQRSVAIEKYKLTRAQTTTMDTFLEGLRKDAVEPMDTRRITMIAACYAHEVKISDRLNADHHAFLQNFKSVRLDPYPWFSGRGLGEDSADDLMGRMDRAFNYCERTVRR